MMLHSSGVNQEKKFTMSQYLSKYLFNKYEYEAIFATSQYGLSVRIFMNPELVSDVVDDSKTTMTILRIICNYIIDTFGKCSILPEEAMHNIGKGCMEEEYGRYEYENDKGMEHYCISFWYIYVDCLITFEAYHIMCKTICCCKVCRKRAIFVGAPNLTTKENCGLSEPKPC